MVGSIKLCFHDVIRITSFTYLFMNNIAVISISIFETPTYNTNKLSMSLSIIPGSVRNLLDIKS